MKTIKLSILALALGSFTFQSCGDGSDSETTNNDTTTMAPADNTADGVSDATATEGTNSGGGTTTGGTGTTGSGDNMNSGTGNQGGSTTTGGSGSGNTGGVNSQTGRSMPPDSNNNRTNMGSSK